MRLLPFYCRLVGPLGTALGILVPCGGLLAGGLVGSQSPTIGASVAAATVAISGYVLWRLRPFAESLRIAATGRPGVATLVAFRDTGTTINTAVLVTLHLDVRKADGSVYRVSLREPVPRVAVGRLVPGGELPVMIDREDPGRVTLRPAA